MSSRAASAQAKVAAERSRAARAIATPPTAVPDFSIIQRKVLTPNGFARLEEVERRLRLYEELRNREPRPFEWKFDRAALLEFLARLEAKDKLVC